MSTELKSIPTLWKEITVTRFYGGGEAGASIQLGQRDRQNNEYGYIQISQRDLPAVIAYLAAFLDNPIGMEEAE